MTRHIENCALEWLFFRSCLKINNFRAIGKNKNNNFAYVDFVCYLVRHFFYKLKVYKNVYNIKNIAEGILAMWKISEDELVFRKMQGVIANALNLQKNIASFKNGETYKGICNIIWKFEKIYIHIY